MRGGPHGHGRFMGDVDKHGFLPKLSAQSCLRVMLCLAATADAIGHAFAWIGISRGLSPTTLRLAEKEAEHYTFECDTVDVAAGGLLRGLVVLLVVVYLTCCVEEGFVERRSEKLVIGDDYKRGEKFQPKGMKCCLVVFRHMFHICFKIFRLPDHTHDFSLILFRQARFDI